MQTFELWFDEHVGDDKEDEQFYKAFYKLAWDASRKAALEEAREIAAKYYDPWSKTNGDAEGIAEEIRRRML
jgi:hypothetical protein